MSSSNLTHLSGYLKVRGTWGSYTKYWFVLQQSILSRYKSQKDSAVLESLDLSKHVSVMNAEGITYVMLYSILKRHG